MMSVEIFPAAMQMSEAAAKLFAARAAGAVSARGRFIAALSGGKTPVGIYSLLAKAPFASQIPWARVHLFWADERCVPPDHADSNYRLVRELLLDYVPIPAANVHRIPAEMDPVEAAARYEGQLREFFAPHGDGFPVFDCILLGLGDDGHTASLFPNTPRLREESSPVIASRSPVSPVHRVSLSLRSINAARCVLFLTLGKHKSVAVARVMDQLGREDAHLPAAMVNPERGALVWFLDYDAAALLNRESGAVSTENTTAPAKA